MLRTPKLRLALRSEIVRRLTGLQLGRVHGGQDGISDVIGGCPDSWDCPTQGCVTHPITVCRSTDTFCPPP